jgi:hypothetical protein
LKGEFSHREQAEISSGELTVLILSLNIVAVPMAGTLISQLLTDLVYICNLDGKDGGRKTQLSAPL